MTTEHTISLSSNETSTKLLIITESEDINIHHLLGFLQDSDKIQLKKLHFEETISKPEYKSITLKDIDIPSDIEELKQLLINSSKYLDDLFISELEFTVNASLSIYTHEERDYVFEQFGGFLSKTKREIWVLNFIQKFLNLSKDKTKNIISHLINNPQNLIGISDVGNIIHIYTDENEYFKRYC